MIRRSYLLRRELACAAVLGGWWASGCQAPPASAVNSEPEQRVATLRVLGASHELREDQVYPAPETRHVLRWKAGRFEWQITLADRAEPYAAVLLQRPLDLRRYRPKSYLRFRIQPDVAAADLYLGLADRRADGTDPVMVILPLAPYRTWQRNALGYYAIPLKAFGDRGWVLASNRQRAPSLHAGAMDWSRVGEFRIGTQGRPAWRKPFVVSRFEIGVSPRVSEE
ncbi:MAG TPA: hypothetical protein P5567_13755 [Kiritimatiellia bacterium]|nr:hypothetical protein [Kiritimatiellia bacterium]HRZ13506.1 hypothetical protein [Kiritimatiellia bacterium]HSA19189.1 hypothetical protein [Kiritimatiellia bacterium]